MENSGNSFNGNSTTRASSSRSSKGYNGHFSSNSWEAWDLANARFEWCQVGQDQATGEEGRSHAPLYGGGVGSHYHPDPHLVCLNLGKRHYFESATLSDDRHVDMKRWRPVMYDEGPTTAATLGVPRCQVEGCHVALMNAKDYHRRHKVCEMHSKAPRVVVLGVEQRFCQQCSRFHAVSEFDDSKRSCRRRLAGHNERRRKGSHENGIIPKNHPQEHALCLLSSPHNNWLSSADLSTRGSAALHELIAENRACNFAQQIILERGWSINQCNHSMVDEANINNYRNQIYSEPQRWDRYNEVPNGHVTLDLMQAQNSAFSLLSVRGKSTEEEEGCSELMWRSSRGSNEM